MTNPFIQKLTEEPYEIKKLKEWDSLYYEEGTPVVSDAEYDTFKEKAREKYPTHSYFKNIGAEVKGRKVKLPFTLGSLNKTKPDGSFEKWNEKFPGNKIITPKLDGVSILVNFKDGKVQKAYTRGNGEYGRDITGKARLFCPGVDYNEALWVRGECLLTGTDHEELGFKTRRNGVAGLLNNDVHIHCDKIKVIFYELVEGPSEIETEYERLSFLKKILPRENMISFALNKEIAEYELENVLELNKKDSPYDIDGLVITLDNSEREDTKYPEHKVAFKVSEPAIEAIVKNVEWCTGRTGRIVPLVHIHPVKIQGVEVSKATGHNWKYICDTLIGTGARISLQRSGDVIPYIVGVKQHAYVDLAKPDCPSCGCEPTITKTGVDLVCLNPECPAQKLARTEYFFLTLGAENISEKTFKSLGISSIQEALEITRDFIRNKPGFGNKRAEQIIQEIEKCLTTRPDKLLASFGIPGIGVEMARTVLKHFDFDEIWTLKAEDFIKVPGFGEILAKNLEKGLEKYKEIYEYLLNKGLTFEVKQNTLRGKMFCLTGNGPLKRNELQKIIESKGGFVKGMSKKIDYLVCGNLETTSSKAQKARGYGIPLITYEQLMEILDGQQFSEF